MVLFLLIRIIASTLRSSDRTSAHHTLEHADTQAETVQEVCYIYYLYLILEQCLIIYLATQVYTVPSEHKVVINNYQVRGLYCVDI